MLRYNDYWITHKIWQKHDEKSLLPLGDEKTQPGPFHISPPKPRLSRPQRTAKTDEYSKLYG